jgi:hypothetical protein
MINMLMLMLLPLVQTNGTPPIPNESTPASQFFLGLGLSATMLVGFLFLIAFLILGWLAMSWTRKDERTPRPSP